ncbi:hypothetical protein DRP05_03560 [Archaeoglobales archaeon]|nr:MAG: hypothetical protein DRP05_03560 [Archaeoglobales archaeon]
MSYLNETLLPEAEEFAMLWGYIAYPVNITFEAFYQAERKFVDTMLLILKGKEGEVEETT